MKHLNIYVLFLLAILLMGSCRKKYSGKFPEMKQLSADSIETPPVLLSVTSLFMVGDDTLGVYQQKDDTLFSFWKLPECKFLFKAGIKGQGPNDFLALDKTFQGYSGGFKAFEIQTGKVKNITFADNGTFNIQAKKLKVDETMNRFIFLGKDAYCFSLMMGDSEFGIYNEKEGLRHIGQYPDLITKKAGEMDVFVYNKVTVAHPDGNKFAVFYAYLKMCRIYGSDGVLQEEVHLGGPVELENGQRKTYYSTQPYATDKYIYVLANERDGNVLEVWNWEAEMVGRYLMDKDFDRFFIYKGKLFGFSRVNESVVYTYQMN